MSLILAQIARVHRSGGGGGGTWTPAALSPSVWLNDDSPLTLSGSNCQQWNDITGNGNHFNQVTTGLQPAVITAGLNGRRTISFNGSNYLTGTGGNAALTNNIGALSIFMVCNPDVDTSGTRRLINYGIYSATNNTSPRAGVQLNGANLIGLSQRRLDTDSASQNNVAYSTKAWRVLEAEFIWSSASSQFRMDGGTVQTVATGQGAGNTAATNSFITEIGGDGFVSGQNTVANFAEIVVLTSILSDIDRQKMEGYLAWRWGLQGNLPAGHPYKSVAP